MFLLVIDHIVRIVPRFRLWLPFSDIFFKRSHSLTGLRTAHALPESLLTLRAAELYKVIVPKGPIKVRKGSVPRMALSALVIRNE
jgi:hypothetical protein